MVECCLSSNLENCNRANFLSNMICSKDIADI